MIPDKYREIYKLLNYDMGRLVFIYESETIPITYMPLLNDTTEIYLN